MDSDGENAHPNNKHQRTERIRQLNDAFRTGNGRGRLAITRGVIDLGRDCLAEILGAVRTFPDFNAENDPHGEHDFGTIEHRGQRIFWKIDYYDIGCCFGSPDAADDEATTRVLTVMLATEY